jgi:NADH dehydrogenase
MGHLAHRPHLFLIGFRNRISVFAAWVWTYFTFTRGARLITGEQCLPGWKEQIAAGPIAPSNKKGQIV